MAFEDRLTGPIRGFKDDPIGFLLRGVDNGQRVPVTRTRTAYSLTIHATVGNRRGVIGAVHEISTRQRQDIEEEFEVNSLGTGLPRELIPQNVTGRSIQLSRYDLYKSTLEQVFGTPELITLADQLGPVSLRMMWKNPNSGDIDLVTQSQSTISVYEYTDCYITDLTRTVSMGNVIVGTGASLTWRGCRPLQ